VGLRLGYCALVAAVIVGAYAVARTPILQARAGQLAAAPDPLALIQEQHEAFTYDFNRLGIEQQAQILTRLSEASKTSKDVFCSSDWPDAQSAARLFVPACLIVTRPKQRGYARIHVFAYLSDRWTPPSPPADQGPVGSWLYVEGRACPFPNLGYDEQACVYTRIGDANWSGRYYGFALPVSSQFGQKGCAYRIGFVNLVADGTRGFVNRRGDDGLVVGSDKTCTERPRGS
jgi:hypothetical protein